MKPHIRTALYSTGAVLLVVGILFARLMLRMSALNDGSPAALQAQLVWLGLFALVTVLGLSIAWWRVFRDARERRNRPKPLDFG